MISAQATKKFAGRKKKISSPKSPSLLFLGSDQRQVHLPPMAAIADLLSARAFQVSK